MNREEAIKIVKSATVYTPEEMEALETLVPELRESEDEKIRKWLNRTLKALNTSGVSIDGAYEMLLPSIDWLEKQKEPEDIIGKAMSYFGAESLLDNANGLSDFEKFTAWLYCEFLRGLPKKLNQEYIKEQTKVILDAAQEELCKMPDSTELIEMWDKEKAKLEEKDFRGDTWRVAYNAFLDGFARGTCVKFDRQKEQKPVEKSEIELTEFEESLNTFLFNFAHLPMDDCDPKEYIKKYSAEILKNAYKELRGKLEEDIFEARQEGIRDGIASVKPAEWSEEDKKLLDFWLDVIDRNDWRMDENFCKASREFINRLKSLRHSWKPSEEQMEALKKVACNLVGTGTETDVYLVQLYEQLKAL